MDAKLQLANHQKTRRIGSSIGCRRGTGGVGGLAQRSKNPVTGDADEYCSASLTLSLPLAAQTS